MIVRRIFNLIIRTIANLFPPSSLKSFLYRLSGIKIGKKVHISHGVYIVDGYRPGLVEIADGVNLAQYVVLIPSSHPTTSPLAEMYQVSKVAKIRIKKGAWIGVGAVILPGVTIGEFATVGPNAVIHTDVPDYAIVVGYPPRQVGDVRTKPEIKGEKGKDVIKELYRQAIEK